jgi:hypothetical protein
MGMSEQPMLIVASFFKGITLNKMRRLDHQLLRRPETHTFKSLGYVFKLGGSLASRE